jgi:hypothetical protein
MIYKTAFKIALAFVYFYICAWFFNHTIAWIGIVGGLVGVIFLLDKLIKKFKDK